MPKGIILSSGSAGATQEDVAAVLAKHGYEADVPEVPEQTELVEPKREDFQTDEEFATAQETFEAAQEEAEEKAEAEKEKEAAQKPHKRNRTQKVVEKELAPLKEEIKNLRAKLEPEKPAAKSEKLEAPKREDFKSDEEFDEAKFQYRYKLQRQKDADEESRKQAEETQKLIAKEREEHWNNYKTAGETFKEENPDWDEVVGKADLKITQLTYETIIALENPALTYYIGKHPDFAEKLLSLSPYLVGVELARLDAKLASGALKPEASAERATPKPKRQLPEPVRPVSTAATSSTVTTKTAKSYKEFKAAHRAGRLG